MLTNRRGVYERRKFDWGQQKQLQSPPRVHLEVRGREEAVEGAKRTVNQPRETIARSGNVSELVGPCIKKREFPKGLWNCGKKNQTEKRGTTNIEYGCRGELEQKEKKKKNRRIEYHHQPFSITDKKRRHTFGNARTKNRQFDPGNI